MSLWKVVTVLVFLLWPSDGRPASACKAVTGEDLKAPRSILRAVFCNTSSWCRGVGEAEPYTSHP